MTKILLKNQWKILINTLKTQPRKNLVGAGVAYLVVGYFLYLFGKLIWSTSADISLANFESLISFGLLAITGLIIMMGLPHVFKSLYSGSDLQLLFTMPIPTRHIFWVKYIQSYAGIPLFIFIIAAVPIVVYGMAIQAPFLYFVVALLVTFSVTIISLSLIFLLNLLLIQVIPAGRANEFMTVMSFLSGIIVYLMFMLPNIMNDVPLSERLLLGLPLLPNWVPVSWGSSAIVRTMDGSGNAFLPLLLLILLSIFMMMFATTLVERGFRTGWIRISEGTSKKRGKKKREGRATIKINHPIIAIGKKEWFAIKRDLREWLAFMPILFIIIFGLIGFFSGGGDIGEIRGHGDISWPVAQGIFLFIHALTNGMISSSSIGREGPNLWLMRVMPISGKQLAYGKCWISWIIPFAVVTLIEIIAAFYLGWTIGQFFFGVVVKGLITLGMSAIGLWVGTLGAKYNPMNPQQRLTFIASIILLIISYVYLAITLIPVAYLLLPEIALTTLPPDLDHGVTGFAGVMLTLLLKALLLKVNYPILMSIVAFIILLIISIGLAYLFLAISARRINRGLKIDMVSESSLKSLRPRRIGK